jgi:hypothetical protein
VNETWVAPEATGTCIEVLMAAGTVVKSIPYVTSLGTKFTVRIPDSETALEKLILTVRLSSVAANPNWADSNDARLSGNGGSSWHETSTKNKIITNHNL